MSVKHFAEYYRELQKNYNDMVEGLHDLEIACSSGMVEPERIEQFMKTMQPIKDSFLSMQYVKYLLDKPNKKSKIKKYEKLTKNIEKEKYENMPNENDKLLKELKWKNFWSRLE